MNTITPLMAKRILTRCKGSLKGICKFNPKCNCRWQDVFCLPSVYVLVLYFSTQSQAPLETELSMMHITVHAWSEGNESPRQHFVGCFILQSVDFS